MRPSGNLTTNPIVGNLLDLLGWTWAIDSNGQGDADRAVVGARRQRRMFNMVIKDGLGALFGRIKRTVVGQGAFRNPPQARFESLEGRLQFDISAVEPPAVLGAPEAAGDLLPDLIPWASKENGYIYGWHL